jgi:hypothetical protein
MRNLLWIGLVAALGGCVGAASASPVDGGAPDASPKRRAKKQRATEEEGLGSIGRGGGWWNQPYPQCMPASEAVQRSRAPENGGSYGDGSIGIGLGKQKAEPSKEIPECPAFIWTFVGAGHGARPVGNVQAPLGLPNTRHERKRVPHSCCYLIPPAPGSPMG